MADIGEGKGDFRKSKTGEKLMNVFMFITWGILGGMYMYLGEYTHAAFAFGIGALWIKGEKQDV